MRARSRLRAIRRSQRRRVVSRSGSLPAALGLGLGLGLELGLGLGLRIPAAWQGCVGWQGYAGWQGCEEWQGRQGFEGLQVAGMRGGGCVRADARVGVR